MTTRERTGGLTVGESYTDLSEVARWSRRRFLAAGGAALLAACSGGKSDGATRRTTTTLAAPRLSGYPFTLGVASGDPLPDGMVLWTRLAPEPLEGGGMPTADVEVRWEVAEDDGMRDVVASGRVLAMADFAHSARIDVRKLDPGRPYWYRFTLGDDESPIARTRTAPARRDATAGLRLAHVSCQHWGTGEYAAYRDMVDADDLDLVVHCGDYIYESTQGPVRPVPLPEPTSLDDYRNTHALYRGDEHLQAAHRMAPWLLTWDDHEVENNYQGTAEAYDSTTPGTKAFAARRTAAYQAWWEHAPTRLDAPTGPDLDIYRRFQWGQLADLLVLDTRQHRSDQVCAEEDIGPRCDAAQQPDFTVLGDVQEQWLRQSLDEVSTTWTVIAQQIVLSQWRFAPGDGAWNLDQWDGYPLARERLLGDLRDSGAPSPVVLTGDVHSSWVGTIADDFDDPASPVRATEFVGPGVSSEAPGLLGQVAPTLLDQSPHLAWGETEHRGWVRHEVSPTEWSTEYRFVDDPADAASGVSTGARWHLPAGGQVERA